MISTAAARTRDFLCLSLLALTLVTPYALGAVGAYLQMLCALAAVAVLAFDGQGLAIRGDYGFKLLLVAFAMLALAFALTARQPHDVVYVLNFAALLAFGPLSRLMAGAAAPDNARRVATLALIGTFAALLLALFQVFVGRYVRAAGWGTDPIWSAEAAVILGFIAALGWVMPGRWRLVYLLGPLFGVAISVLAGSRGPLLAVPALALILVVASRRRWLSLAVIVLGGAALWLILRLILPALFDRAMSLIEIGQQLTEGVSFDQASSAGTRLLFYQSGIAAFLHSPVIGYGWVDKMQAILPYLPNDGPALIAPHRHLHSDVLDFGVAAGTAGLIAYALILIGPILAVLRGPRDGQYRFRLAGICIVAGGYALCGLSYLMFGYEFHSALYACLAAILVGYCRDAPPQPEGRPERKDDA